MIGNIWRRFGELIKPANQEIVTITQILGNGAVLASTVGGGQVRLRSAIDVKIGDKAFAQAGEIKGKAPKLPYFELEI